MQDEIGSKDLLAELNKGLKALELRISEQQAEDLISYLIEFQR